jgi:KUP system potassium uptake protein
MLVFRRQYGWSALLVGAVFGPLLWIDLMFFLSNVLKIPEGGWVPLVLGIALFTLMETWHRGRALLFSRFRQDSLPLKSFLARLPQSRTIRVPGIAVFMTGQADYVPHALLHNLKHNKVLHKRVVFLTVVIEEDSHVSPKERLEVERLDAGFWRVRACYGFMEEPNVQAVLDLCAGHGLEFKPMETTFFLSRETVIPGRNSGGMATWRDRLFAVMARNATSATAFFRLPANRVVELGMQVEI